jgi:Phage Mu protein F like protein
MAKPNPHHIAEQLTFDWSGIKGDLEYPLGTAASNAAVDTLTSFSLSIANNADLFGMTHQAAVDWASNHAAEMVVQISDGTREFVRGTVAQALDEGWSAQQLKAELRSGYAFSNDRALTIARSEINNAHAQGGLIAAKQSGAVDQKQWLDAGDSCDDCQGNAAVGPIPIDEDFPSGHPCPTAHPNCRCSLAYSRGAGAGEEAAA